MSRDSHGANPSPSNIAEHLACRHLTQLRRALAERRIDIELPSDPRAQALRLRGKLHEESYVEHLRDAGRSIVDLHSTSDLAATIAAMEAGHSAIIQAPLGDDRFQARADVLLRTESKSRLGSFSYEPVDAKLAEKTRAGSILQLCAYAVLLEPLQELMPRTLHIFTPAGAEGYRSADYLAYFRFVRRQLLAAIEETPPPTTYPEPVPHCDICRFWLHCDRIRRRDDHLSLVAGIRTLHTRELQRQGITTLTGLSSSNGKFPEPPARGSVEVFHRLGRQARLQQQARDMDVPPWEMLPVEPGRGLCRLPEPSPDDVFLDLEGDPFVAGGGLEYLFGWAWKEADELLYDHHFARDQTEERTAVESFFDFVDERASRFPNAHVYFFGAYEPAALKRLVGRYGVRAESLDQLLRGERLIDLHAILRESVRVGVERYGLKELEAVTNFHRRQDLREAAKARLAMELALEFGAPETVEGGDAEAVRLYNRDDCCSAAALRDWLEDRRAELRKIGVAIPRPVVPDSAPSETVAERDRSIQEVADALIADLSDTESRSDEERAQWLLAQMLGYFRREEKCAWWEHFRLRELDAEALREERDAVAGLELAEVIPPKGRRRIPTHRYRFPDQESALDTGDRVRAPKTDDPEGGRFGEVTAIDLTAGILEVRPHNRTKDLRPRALFKDQNVPTGSLEESLLELGRKVVRDGIDSAGPFRAARDLLLRCPPRRRAGSSVPLAAPEEDAVAATIRLCRDLECGVLPIQGPPGSGKTYVGARTILALAPTHRIGVTATSHKVIDNLLEEVGRAADQQSIDIELVHKDDGGTASSVHYIDANDQAARAVGPGTLVGGTAWFWARKELAQTLDFLIVDEAGQMSLAQVLAAARATQNLVLLGDPQQLEQPHRGTHPEGADVAALVHVLGLEGSTLSVEQGLFLNRTWRLHPDLCAFTSETYYDNRLASIAGLETQELVEAGTFSGSGLFLVEVSHDGNQASSDEEAMAVAWVIEEILTNSPGPHWVDRDRKERPLRRDDILVVAPYNAQVASLRRRLQRLGVDRIGTVDKFQGQEAPVVIYSCTSSSPDDAPRGMAFLYDPHRFNVATSRARCATIVVACPRLFEPQCRSPEQMRWANGLCRFRELATVVEAPAGSPPRS